MSSVGRLPSKVVPSAQVATSAGTRAATVLHNFPYAYYQNTQYGPHDLVACTNSAGDGATILIYDMNSVQLVQTLTGGLGPSCSVTCIQWLQPSSSFMQHGVFLISGNERGELLYWDVTAGVPLQRLFIPCRQPVQLLQLLSDDRVLVVTNTAATYVFHTHLVDPTPLTAKASGLPLRSRPSPSVAAAPDVTATSAVANLASASRRAFETSFKNTFSMHTSNTGTPGSPASAPVSPAVAGASVGAGDFTAPYFPPQHFCTSKLASVSVCAVTLGDRVRLITAYDDTPDAARHEDPVFSNSSSTPAFSDGAQTKPLARDLVYDTEDGEATVMDAFFSEAQEDVLFFATRSSVGTYDWRIGTILTEQVVWMQDAGVEFRRIFPSSAVASPLTRSVTQGRSSSSSSAADGKASIPLLYSFGSDQRLVAWYLIRTDKFTTVTADVRGARITSKSVAQVTQSPSNPTRFAIVFEDSTVADWRYCLRTRRWKQEGVCTFALSHPLFVCRMSPYTACYALDSGHMVLADLHHSQALRKLSVVYSGGTKMILACQDRWEELVWVVTHRMEDGQHHHQVSLLDTRSGEVVRVLRKPHDKADAMRMKEASMDPAKQYLLLSFWNGTFEVWNTSESRLLHIYTGLGVAAVAWAPACMRRCLSGVQGQPQMLAILFSDGTLSFWSVYKDRVVVSRDSVPLFASNLVSGGAPRGCAVGDRLVLFDNTGNGLSLWFDGKLVAKRFRELPIQASGPVVCLDSAVPWGGGIGEDRGSAQASSASWQPGSSTLSAVFAGGSMGGDLGGSTGERALSPLKDVSQRAAKGTEEQRHGGTSFTETPDTVPSAQPLVVAVFEDHSFGVWNAQTGECVAYSRTTAASRLLDATQAFWLEGSLVVVSTDGTTYVMDQSLTRLNSSIRSKALRRPMQTMAFLLASQRTSLQASLLLLDNKQADIASTLSDSNRGNRLADDTDERSASASVLVTGVDRQARPCRGPLGQVIDETVTTLSQELQLYRNSMVPPRVARFLARSSAIRNGPARALAVAELFGQLERQRFWFAACEYAAEQHHTQCGTPASSYLSTPLGCCAAVTAVAPYVLADALSPALAHPAVSRNNHHKLGEQRTAALNRHRDRNVDDSRSRLLVARRWLMLSEPGKAVDLLLDANYEIAGFNELATLSVAIAGGANVAPGGSSAANAALLSRAAHHAAALLLAQGDVDAAVEKYLLAGDISEACTAFQSRGQWANAALLAKWMNFPSAPLCLANEVVGRWAKHCERQRRVLPAARLMLSLGAIRDTLEVLRGYGPTADVAGLFALCTASAYFTSPENALVPGRADAPVDQDEREALRTSLVTALIDFAGVLNSVGNDACEAEVLRCVGRLKSAGQTSS